MKNQPTSIAELLEIYDWLRKHCRMDPLIKRDRTLRMLLQDMALKQAIRIIRVQNQHFKNKREIAAVCFYYPTSGEASNRLMPEANPEGEFLWCQFCYADKRHFGRGEAVDRFLAMAGEEFPKITHMIYRRTKRPDKIRWRKLIRKEGEVVQ